MTQPPITRTARTDWSSRREHKRRRLERVTPYVEGKLVRRDAIVAALEALLTPGDRVVLEGDIRSRRTSCRVRSRRSIPRACTTYAC